MKESFKEYYRKTREGIKPNVEETVEEGLTSFIKSYKDKKQAKKQAADDEVSERNYYARGQLLDLTKEYIQLIKQDVKSADQRFRREIFDRNYPEIMLRTMIFFTDSTLLVPKTNKDHRLVDMLSDAIIKKFNTDNNSKSFKSSYEKAQRR